VQSDKEIRRVDASTFEPSEIHLEPSRSWTLELSGAHGKDGSWAFPGINSGNPVLFFDNRTGALLPHGRAIRSDTVWALGPVDVEFRTIDTNDPVRVVQQLPDLTGSWSGLQVTYLDLNDVTAFAASYDGRETKVRVQPAAAVPHLLDSELDQVATADGRPVFTQFPRVQLPRFPGLEQTSWKVRYVAGELDIELDIGDDFVVIGPSELPAIVPEAFLTVRGPLGSDFKLRFALAAGLRLRCPDGVLFPGDRHSEITLSGPQIQVDGHSPGTAVTLEDGRARVDAELVADGAKLDVAVRIPRVVWSTVDESRRPAALGDEVGSATTDDLLDGRVSGIVIQAGRSELPLTLRLKANEQTLQESEHVRTSGIDGRWVFDLGRFSDTIRASDAGRLELRAVIGHRPVPVLRLHASAGIWGVHVPSSRLVGDDLYGTIRFSCSRRVAGLVARFWPLDRPWGDPVEVSIPDLETEAGFSFETSRVPPGAYLAEVAVEDLWSKPTRPRVSERSTSVVQLAHGDDYRARLDQLAGGDALAVLEHALATGDISRDLSESEFDEIAGPAVDSLLLFLQDKSLPPPRGIESVEELLTMRPPSMVAGLVDRLGDKRTTPSDRLRLVLQIIHQIEPAAIGEVDEEALRLLWVAAPPLAARLDFVSKPRREQVERYQEFLGWVPDDGFDAIATRAALRNIEVNRPAELLREWRKRMELLRSTLLDKDTFAAAQFEWLIAEHENQWGVPSIMDQHRVEPDYVVSTDRVICRHIESRMPEPGTLPIARFPYELLRSAVSFCQETERRSPGYALVNAAVAFAPRLVEHDLVLAQLMQVFGSQEGETS
jgi:hypothetical protein